MLGMRLPFLRPTPFHARFLNKLLVGFFLDLISSCKILFNHNFAAEIIDFECKRDNFPAISSFSEHIMYTLCKH